MSKSGRKTIGAVPEVSGSNGLTAGKGEEPLGLFGNSPRRQSSKKPGERVIGPGADQSAGRKTRKTFCNHVVPALPLNDTAHSWSVRGGKRWIAFKVWFWR